MSESSGDPGPRHFFGVLPVFLVDDVPTTALYYHEVLGFEIDFLYGEPPIYASVSRDEAVINFTQSDPPGRRNGVSAAGAGNGVDSLIIVSDLDELYGELRERGASIVSEPRSQAYGLREFQIEDCNHYRIALAEEVEEVEEA